MGIWTRWKLGEAAVGLYGAARDALKHIDRSALLAAVAAAITAEISDPSPGKGAAKWEALRDWFIAAFPQHEARIDTLAAVVRALVALLNAVGVFRSRVNGSATTSEPRA